MKFSIGLLFGLWMSPLMAGDQPNILFIIADDASRDSFGAYGCQYVKTPGFDRI
ncbi:MAG: arylsulfatase, partial [Planctomycetaceae bacterium]|nr:arylsulfatase [Planctomycetaceae bacterium]